MRPRSEEVDRTIVRIMLYLGSDETSRVNRANARRIRRQRQTAEKLRSRL
jgi:hypothetical protein